MIKKIICLIVVPTLLSSCSFKSASGAAAHELMDRGAFPGEAPAWVSQSSIRNAESGNNASAVSGGFRRTTSQNVLSRRNEAEKLEKQRASALPKEDKSPLDKILEVCPRIEQELTKALVTVDPQERIVKYEGLTKRCAISPDLWTWLGNDYLATGDNLKAKFCATRAISLDPRNDEANQLLAKAGNRK